MTDARTQRLELTPDDLPAGIVPVDDRCPSCEHADLLEFFRETAIPTNSCLLLGDAQEARDFPTGDMRLCFCATCGFISNVAFEPELAEYSQRYEETQAFSKHFTAFGRALAERWVNEYDLAGKTVLEIGCGKGEFLTWMVEAGVGHGIGIDPGVHPERIDSELAGRLTWIADFYDEQSSAELEADAIVCRHTLEHIAPVRSFMELIRRSLGDRTDVPILFELPDVLRVIDETAFWDVYYEHCSYFTLGSLARLFRSSGFDIAGLGLEYDNQYLVVEAFPSPADTTGQSLPVEDDLDRLWRGVTAYADRCDALRTSWTGRFQQVHSEGGRAVIWGGGSKGVSFLTGLGVGDLVDAAVDINPHKAGRYLAGAGHEILSPAQLVDRRPDLVVAMNPVYVPEIRAELGGLGIEATVEAV